MGRRRGPYVRPRKLRPDDVKALAKFLARKYRADVVHKKGDPRMDLAQEFLELVKVPAAKTFLDNYATTLMPPLLVFKPTVFLPFKPGSKAKAAPPLNVQWEVICHEFHHVRQWRADPLGWCTRYATKKAERARVESEALEVNMEQEVYLTGTVPNPGLLAIWLIPYGLRKMDIAVVTKHLRSKALTVSRGGVNKTISQQVIAWDRRRTARQRKR